MRVSFDALTMNQQSQAYGDYRLESNDIHCSYSEFRFKVAEGIDWNSETGKPWKTCLTNRTRCTP